MDMLANRRAHKTAEEIDVIREGCKICSESHIAMMHQMKPGLRESYFESAFKSFGMKEYNIKQVSYGCICGSGVNSATLHYEDNNEIIDDGQLVLLDMGYSLCQYASDITITIPANGKYSPVQQKIYNIVLKANRMVQSQLKSGIKWPDMHLLAETIILEGLKELGIVKGDVKEMVEKRVGYLFMPHGLGHLMGLDVHDVGGYLSCSPPRNTKPGLKNLRTARALEEGMVITVEPGCYFIPFLWEEGAKLLNIDTSYLVMDELKNYAKFGGIRIEDDVVIMKDGIERLTCVPRTVEQVEACMRGEDWTKFPDLKI